MFTNNCQHAVASLTNTTRRTESSALCCMSETYDWKRLKTRFWHFVAKKQIVIVTMPTKMQYRVFVKAVLELEAEAVLHSQTLLLWYFTTLKISLNSIRPLYVILSLNSSSDNAALLNESCQISPHCITPTASIWLVSRSPPSKTGLPASLVNNLLC